MLCQLLDRHGHNARSIPIGTTSEMLSQVTDAKPDLIYISALPPFAVEHSRVLYSKLRLQLPEVHIIICLWQFEGDTQTRCSGLDSWFIEFAWLVSLLLVARRRSPRFSFWCLRPVRVF